MEIQIGQLWTFLDSIWVIVDFRFYPKEWHLVCLYDDGTLETSQKTIFIGIHNDFKWNTVASLHDT